MQKQMRFTLVVSDTGTWVPNLNLYGDSTNGISSKLNMHENIKNTIL